MVENENFLKFSNMVQNTWLKYLASLVTVGVAKYFTICAICQRFVFRGKHLTFLIISILSIWGVSNFIPLSFLYFPAWYAYLIYIVYSCVYQNEWKKLFGFMAIGFEFAFSTISMLTRSISLQVISEYLIAYILSIDVYIMIILYYLYTNLIKLNKENEMIVIGSGWLGKEEAQKNGYTAWKRFWHNVGYALSFKWLKKSK